MVTRFDVSGGRLCLDLPNTVSNRGSDAPVDHLRSYADVLAWAGQARAAPADVVRALRRRAAADPAAARRALAATVALREILFRLFGAVAHQRRPRAEDLAALNAAIPEAFARSRLTRTRGGYTLRAEARGDNLASPLAPVVTSAIDLLTSSDADRVRSCAADACEWLFMDTTKNRTRRWCDMKVCGNREKVRRFRERSG